MALSKRSLMIMIMMLIMVMIMLLMLIIVMIVQGGHQPMVIEDVDDAALSRQALNSNNDFVMVMMV